MSHTANIELYDLIMNESDKIPDKSGDTPIIILANKIRRLNNLSREKIEYEKEVCNLESRLSSFSEIQFSELESYIDIANFSTAKILKRFSEFVKRSEPQEDIVLKACVVRFIQNYNKAAFQLDFLKERFFRLEKKDPWLYAEIIANVNWDEAINVISKILKEQNDSNYLFPLITKWMTYSENEENLNKAFNIWIKYLNEEDKELLITFCDQYNYKKPDHNSEKEYSTSLTLKIELEQNQELKSFKIAISKSKLKYESIIS